MANKLLLLTRENEIYRELITQCKLPDLIILNDASDSIIEADIWFAEPALAAPLIDRAKNLRWLQSTFAGVDKLVMPALRRDYQLTNVRGIFGPLMSEYLFGYLLAHQREHHKYKQQQQQQNWLPGSYKTLQGQHLLLLGTGSIAQHIAATAKHFGMVVTGINRLGTATHGFDQVDSIDNLACHLRQADVVASILPNTPDTDNILNQQNLSLLKPAAIIFNLGRGNVLDLNALTAQLNQTPNQQAILDVFTQEPLPKTHPIWSCANAIITPHIAAPSFPAQIVALFSSNYHLWRNQQPLNYVIDFDKGY
ncbi:D-2-hydroxyacid dehydrogenase [Shewanella sp. OMA3-2]|uniref:D-2-hydroxyacid dehydrogenase n=1 Tax=Shewanella sp. OMA3-2 TaxID=2908650 RepID=UPI001F3402E9|nr:D-2-hydroxyacid dehydrogenase [Shewanella sp. OMA3-2]UJF21794.1 D-2-hydroxyacid dehydrogenase [Shewanella sp. OMA3-2]